MMESMECIQRVINNIEFMIYDNADDDIEQIFESLLNRFQYGLEISMRHIGFFLRLYSFILF